MVPGFDFLSFRNILTMRNARSWMSSSFYSEEYAGQE